MEKMEKNKLYHNGVTALALLCIGGLLATLMFIYSEEATTSTTIPEDNEPLTFSNFSLSDNSAIAV